MGLNRAARVSQNGGLMTRLTSDQFLRHSLGQHNDEGGKDLVADKKIRTEKGIVLNSFGPTRVMAQRGEVFHHAWQHDTRRSQE